MMPKELFKMRSIADCSKYPPLQKTPDDPPVFVYTIPVFHFLSMDTLAVGEVDALGNQHRLMLIAVG
jgi:hypothetical protein